MKIPTPPTDAQLAMARSAIKSILELGREGIGAILLVPYAVADGTDTGLKLITMGISNDFAVVLLGRAQDIVAHSNPQKSGVMNDDPE